MILPEHRNCEKVAEIVRQRAVSGVLFDVLFEFAQPLRGERVNSDDDFSDKSRVFTPGEQETVAIHSVRLRGPVYEPVIVIREVTSLATKGPQYVVPWMQVFDSLAILGSGRTLRDIVESTFLAEHGTSVYDDPKASRAVQKASRPPHVKNDELEPDLAVLEWLDKNTTDGVGDF